MFFRLAAMTRFNIFCSNEAEQAGAQGSAATGRAKNVCLHFLIREPAKTATIIFAANFLSYATG